MNSKRFDIFFERYIGIGISWDNGAFPFHLSLSIPFVTVTIGFGSYDHVRRLEDEDE